MIIVLQLYSLTTKPANKFYVQKDGGECEMLTAYDDIENIKQLNPSKQSNKISSRH